MTCPSRPPGARTIRQMTSPDASAGGPAARTAEAPRAPESDTGGDQAVPVQAVPAQARPVPGAPGETMAAAVQLVIALLTAGLDSPELEAWAVDTLTPVDADGLGDFMAGLHVISVLLLLSELHEATGEPPAAILRRLAILAEHGRGTPSAG
jgi:hypothetical protein